MSKLNNEPNGFDEGGFRSLLDKHGISWAGFYHDGKIIGRALPVIDRLIKALRAIDNGSFSQEDTDLIEKIKSDQKTLGPKWIGIQPHTEKP